MYSDIKRYFKFKGVISILRLTQYNYILAKILLRKINVDILELFNKLLTVTVCILMTINNQQV